MTREVDYFDKITSYYRETSSYISVIMEKTGKYRRRFNFGVYFKRRAEVEQAEQGR